MKGIACAKALRQMIVNPVWLVAAPPWSLSLYSLASS